ncbi:Serralysin C precursor [Ruegeria sp. THAF57]|uniref:M10 family metallopeptidase C-terminal domain-containing protein n=1 Tax=Ruegeria sp. THAF57 TaxID=2744555 RepID=UPI0015DF362E|nr:dockerin type I domain-containing protein [Ruegeria sp. THAF57]CAD0186885.1 Serralysin C precursor [Ruegeria sp. THAF57]
MMLQFERVVATGSAALDSGIGDTALKTFNGDTYLYSVTGPGGGVAVWKLSDGLIPQLTDTVYFSGALATTAGRMGFPVSLAGEDQLILSVRYASGLVGYAMNPDGTLGQLHESSGLVGGGNLSAVAQVSTSLGDVLVLAQNDIGQIATYSVDAQGDLQLVQMVSAAVDSMQTVTIGANHVVVASDSISSSFTTFSVDDATGGLSAVDNSEVLATLGIAVPTKIDVVQAYNQSWVIVAGSESNSLSVMKLTSDGRLDPTDHVLDSRHTRFESVQDLSVVNVDGHVFVVAGGGDDGVSLFTLIPNGQLVYLDSFADTVESGLQNVEALSVAHVGDELQVLVSSQQDAGLTQLSVALPDLGVVRKGFGTVHGTAGADKLSGGILDTELLGGAGDDILIAGTGSTTMTGGSGADIFVMQFGSDPTTITDFQAGLDRLDMYDFPLLRTPGQLTFTATHQGARIGYLNEKVELISASGGGLTADQVFGAGFDGPDHIPVDFGDFGGLDPGSSDGVLGPVTINSETENPALAQAEIRFSLDGGGTVSVRTDEDGRFDLGLPPGVFSGELDIIKTYSTASSDINALDALQVLRMSVGLNPTWGAPAPENIIAADITRDGTVNALDALAILQTAVGQTSKHLPQWVFLDDDADLSGITRSNVDYETGVGVTIDGGGFATDMTSILLGNLEPV